MDYQALYRMYRPQSFDDVVGQTHVTKTLRNAISKGKQSHAYIFSGPRGTGKTSIEKVFVKDINSLDEQSKDILDKVMAYMEKKYISVPMKMAKEILLSKSDL